MLTLPFLGCLFGTGSRIPDHDPGGKAVAACFCGGNAGESVFRLSRQKLSPALPMPQLGIIVHEAGC